ncbi:MAG: chromate transporter [Elusimicrobia bacterium]|nr:chromate transporter [Elusimicrobiota bacterium]
MPTLRELFFTFLKVGCTSFGGPLVAMGLIHREVVEKRRWVSAHWFASTIGLLEAVPGPSATEMSIAIGIHKGGRKWGLICGLAYVLPGFFVMTGLSWFYFKYGAVPALSGMVTALKPCAMAVLTVVCLRLARKIVMDRADALLFAASLLACLMHASVAWVVFLGGLARYAWERPSRALASLEPNILAAIFLGTFKAGALVTGGGYVIASFLNQDFVLRKGWLTPEQFLAGLALAQFKPGPVTMLSAFVGYKAAGFLGAVLGLFGVMLPCFGTLLALGPAVERLRSGPRVMVFLKGMSAASVGSVVAVAAQLTIPALQGAYGFVFYPASLAALYWLEPAWVLAGSACLGALLLKI